VTLLLRRPQNERKRSIEIDTFTLSGVRRKHEENFFANEIFLNSIIFEDFNL
jgi:hypothetical protein